MDIQGILGIDSDVRNGYDDIKVTFHIDADASKKDIEAIVAQSQKRSAVYDVAHQPDERDRRSRLGGAKSAGELDHRTHHDGRHRRRPRRPGDEPLPQRALDRSRGARARGGRQLVAPRALGLAAAADAQLAEPAARLSLRRRRSRRLHDDGRGDRVRLRLRRRGRCAGAHAHDGHVGQADRRRVPTSTTDHGVLRLPLPSCWRAAPAMSRTCRPFDRPCRRPSSASRRSTTAIRTSCRGRRAGRRRVGHRRAAGRRDSPLRPPRDAVGRRARADAEDLSRPRRAVVDGRVRRLEPALRRDRRPHARPEAAVAAAGRNTPAHDAGPQRPHRGRRRARGSAVRRARRPGAFFRRTAQSVRAGRPQDGSTARHVRRVGELPALTTPTSTRQSASSRPACRPRRDCSSTSGAARIRSIVWATGFRPDYSWLDVPVVDRKGHLRHDGGVVDAPGLYAIGLPVLRRRKSTFIHGAEDDARDLVEHLAGYLANRTAQQRA